MYHNEICISDKLTPKQREMKKNGKYILFLVFDPVTYITNALPKTCSKHS